MRPMDIEDSIKTIRAIKLPELRFRKKFKVEPRIENPSQGCVNYLEGLLLGDGNIHSVGSYRQSFAKRRKEWAEKIKRDLEIHGIICRFYQSRNEVNLYTLCEPFLKSLRKKWYPNGEKSVPRDIDFTPDLLLNWYLCDGKLDKDDAVILYTESF